MPNIMSSKQDGKGLLEARKNVPQIECNNPNITVAISESPISPSLSIRSTKLSSNQWGFTTLFRVTGKVLEAKYLELQASNLDFI